MVTSEIGVWTRVFCAALVALGTLVFAVSSQAGVIIEDVDFAPFVVSNRDGKATIHIDGCPLWGRPGEPVLPIYTIKVLLPQGEAVSSINLAYHDSTVIRLRYPIEWGQPMAPLAMADRWQPVMPDETIYESSNPYPERRALHLTAQTYCGYNIAFIRIYPVVYVGKSSEAIYIPRARLTIETRSSARLRTLSEEMLRQGRSRAGDLAKLRKIVTNLDAISTYEASRQPVSLQTFSTLVDPADTYPLVIITNADLKPVFEVLKAHKDSRGLLTRIVLISEIVWNYEGADLPERMRKFIKDAYLYWETEYVLLGGDDEIIPHRGFYAEVLPYVTDNDIPADIYFGTLDGTWNDDMDGRWGEPGEDDLLPEVSVGRASVSTPQEATNFVTKLIRYETSPVASQIKVAQLAGELIYDEPTWGADEKDEIRYGTSAYGFTTVGFPPDYTIYTLYDRDLYPDQWTGNDLIALLNDGRHLVNHAGHCINWMCLRISSSQIPTSFTNDGIANSYLIIYAQGCYSAAFDNRTTDGSYVDDAVAEYFTKIENGAVAYIGNSRYGCGFHGDTRGAAQYYDRQFFDAIFGEGITAIGDAQDDSKIDNIPYIDFRGMRWTYYTLNLIGDPSMDIWTDTPGSLYVSLPQVARTGTDQVVVTVTDGASPVGDARVAIFDESTLYDCAFTDSNGNAYLSLEIANSDSVSVAVIAHNFYAYADKIPVIDGSGPLVVLEQVEVDDDSVVSSSGDGDGVIDAGEVVELIPYLRNVGDTEAADVSASIRTASPHITLLDSVGSFANIPPGELLTPVWGFPVEAHANVSDSQAVQIDFEISYSDTSVKRSVVITLSAPRLSLASAEIADSLTGNGNGCVEPGETVVLRSAIKNSGSGEARDVRIYASEEDQWVTLLTDLLVVGDIDPHTVVTTQPLGLYIAPDCPPLHVTQLDLNLRLGTGLEETLSVVVGLNGSLSDSFEADSLPWQHTEIVKGYVDQWHRETYRNHTPAGSYCWKFGGLGQEPYAHYAHGGLITPQVCLGPNAKLTFWHWMEAEPESANYTSDGGIVEISTDGGSTWQQLVPVGGYTHLIVPGTSTPLPGGTPCFGSTVGWQMVEFDLSAYSGPAWIRFNFAGGEHFGSEEGWYIDDVVIADDVASVRLDEERGSSNRARVWLAPNPSSQDVFIIFELAKSDKVTIDIFDVTGRNVERVLESQVAPGAHLVSWSPQNLSPGTYFVRLSTGGYSQTLKAVHR